jgi:inner membrane protein
MDAKREAARGTPRPARLGVAALWPLGLLALVICLDLIANAGSRSTPEVGALDEPAHLATGVLVVALLVALLRAPPPLAFVAAALVASMAIDVDHIPQYLGWNGLTEGAPRPYTHSLLTPLVLLLAGLLARGRLRAVALGAAAGVCAHLLRDLATASGVALLWPLGSAGMRIPYWSYLLPLLLIACALAALGARRRAGGRPAMPSLRGRGEFAWRRPAMPASASRRASPGQSSPPRPTDGPGDSGTRTRPGPRPSPGISSAAD